MATNGGERGRRIEANRAGLYVEERGQGERLVLAQPGLVSSAVNGGIATRLAEHDRVIIFDSREHG